MKEIITVFWSDEDQCYIAEAKTPKYMGLRAHGSEPDVAVKNLLEAQSLIDDLLSNSSQKAVQLQLFSSEESYDRLY
ncbi:MAG: hypothetical protein QXT45_06825 [Candidatus Bilamarchaeaceae archaeon]